MNEELKDLLEEMQDFFHKGNKLLMKVQKKMGMPSSGIGQRNRPHDLPPAYPRYDGDYDMFMGDYWESKHGMGERGGNPGGIGYGQRGGNGMGQRGGGDYDPRYM